MGTLRKRARNLKSLISLMAVFATLLTPLTALAQAQDVVMVFTIDQKQYLVNGQARQMDVGPTILQGRTLLPIKYAAEPLGADVGWDAASKTATVSLGGVNLELKIGDNRALVNGKSIAIDPDNPNVKPLILGGRTMLPLRFVTENLGSDVKWDPSSMKITVSGQASGGVKPPKQEVFKVNDPAYYKDYYGTVLTLDADSLKTAAGSYKWGVTNTKPMSLQYFAFYLMPEGKYEKFKASFFLDKSAKADLVMEIRKNDRDGVVLKTLTMKPGETIKDLELDIAGVQKLFFSSELRINHGTVDKIVVGEPVFYNGSGQASGGGEVPDAKPPRQEAFKVNDPAYYKDYYGTVLALDADSLKTAAGSYKWGVTNTKPMSLQYFAFYLMPEGKYEKFKASFFLDKSAKADLVMEIRKNDRDGVVLKTLTMKPGETIKDLELDIAGVQKLFFSSELRINHGTVDKIVVGEPVFYNAR